MSGLPVISRIVDVMTPGYYIAFISALVLFLSDYVNRLFFTTTIPVFSVI